jgi:hypothetical protein
MCVTSVYIINIFKNHMFWLYYHLQVSFQLFALRHIFVLNSHCVLYFDLLSLFNLFYMCISHSHVKTLRSLMFIIGSQL